MEILWVMGVVVVFVFRVDQRMHGAGSDERIALLSLWVGSRSSKRVRRGRFVRMCAGLAHEGGMEGMRGGEGLEGRNQGTVRFEGSQQESSSRGGVVSSDWVCCVPSGVW